MSSIRKVSDISKARKKAQKGGWGLQKVSGAVYEPVRLKKKAPVKKKKSTSKKKSPAKKKKSDRANFKENFNPYSVSMTRKFNGKKYSIVTEDRNKKYVESVARRLRAGNAKQMPRNARVVKTSKGYAVYSRNK